MTKIYRSIVLFLWLVLLSLPVQAQTPGVATYTSSSSNLRYFGQWVMHEPGWDRYLMYFSANSSVVNGLPANTSPGDSGTYNNACSTYWADRIWLTWHYGNGVDSAGWQQPILALSIGGPGESALIGDPSVVYWRGKWHMFYEGTDDCSGIGNMIFHATADDWQGPWTKQGMVWGLYGNTSGSGLSWPTVFVNNDNLYLYYTDGNVKLKAAQAIDDTGHNFYTIGGACDTCYVSPDLINRGQVVKDGTQYKLVYDNFGQTSVKVAYSSNPFSFGSGSIIFSTSASDEEIGLPSQVEGRVYFTWISNSGTPNGIRVVQ